MRAYNIEILEDEVFEGSSRGDGWCFGLPPGIRPEQWPLDANTGYPLAHRFTLRLPEDYRVHGPELVALSVFGTAHGDGKKVDEIAALLGIKDAPEPSDATLYPFWMAERLRHPRLHRMADLVGGSFAAILLTQAEIGGTLCQPPVLRANAYRDRVARPAWLDDAPPGRMLQLTARTSDPNAGIAPREDWDLGETGYQPPYFWQGGKVEDENYREHSWAGDHLPNHLGGTMRPAQGVPDVSPFYLEFEEELGGFDFRGGNGWLDVERLEFDWAQ